MNRWVVWLLIVLGGATVVAGCSGLALVGWALDRLYLDELLPPEHQKLLADLERGAFARLEDIAPAPDYVYGAEEAGKPHPRAWRYLKYHLPNGRTLQVAVDQQLRLVDYRVYRH